MEWLGREREQKSRRRGRGKEARIMGLRSSDEARTETAPHGRPKRASGPGGAFIITRFRLPVKGLNIKFLLSFVYCPCAVKRYRRTSPNPACPACR